MAQINLFAPQDGRRKFSGPILGADEDKRQYRTGRFGSQRLDFGNIAKAKLIPDYEKILAGHKTKTMME